MSTPDESPSLFSRNKLITFISGLVVFGGGFLIYKLTGHEHSDSPSPSGPLAGEHQQVPTTSASGGQAQSAVTSEPSFLHEIGIHIAAHGLLVAGGAFGLVGVGYLIGLLQTNFTKKRSQRSIQHPDDSSCVTTLSSSENPPRDPNLSITILPRLDYQLLIGRLNMAKKGDRFVVQKNWLCSSTDALDPDFATGLFDAISRGVDIYIFLLHPRSPSARRRSIQVGFRDKFAVGERVITTVRKLQERYRTRKQSRDEGQLQVYCHDTFSGFELFLHDSHVSGQAWAQLAFYNCLGPSSQFTQFLTETPQRLAHEAYNHAWEYLRRITPSETQNFDAIAIDLNDPNAADALRCVPLLIEAEDVAFALKTVSRNQIDAFTSDISTFATSSANQAPSGSVPYSEVIGLLMSKAIGADSTARSLGVRSVLPQLSAETVGKLIMDTPDGGEFIILDNWLVGHVGTHELSPFLRDAFTRGITVTIILLHPNSILVDRRLSQVPSARSVRGLIKQTLKDLIWEKKQWEQSHKGKTASLKLFLHDTFTSVQLFTGGASACVGFYLKDKFASAGPQLIFDISSDFGTLAKEHLQSITSDTMRCAPFDLSAQIDSQIDGLVMPGQLAEVSEIMCNVSPRFAAQAATVVIDHATKGPAVSHLDAFKLEDPGWQFSSKATKRQEQMWALLTALLTRMLQEQYGAATLKDFDSIISQLSGASAKQIKTLLTSEPKKESLQSFLSFLKRFTLSET